MNDALLIGLFVALGIVFTNEANAGIPVADCEAQITANKGLQILKGKMDLLNSDNQPIEILTNDNVPSRKEKEAIALWIKEQRRCSKPGIDYYKGQSLAIGAILEKAYSETFLSAADLYQGKITYGDFARASVKRHQDVKEQVAGIAARYREQQVAETQQEAEHQRSLRQERCTSLRQRVIALTNGPMPYQVQQLRHAQKYVQQPPLERASAGMHRTGEETGMMPAISTDGADPIMAEAQQRQTALTEQIAIYRRECQ